MQLEALVDNAASGNLDVVREIEALTHRMHGSGAMLHFDEISGCAGELERLAASFVASGTVDQPRMVEILGKLQAAIEKAVAERTPDAIVRGASDSTRPRGCNPNSNNSMKRMRDLGGRELVVAAIPVRNPVQRARQRERRHFLIAGTNRAVVDAGANQAAQALVDFGFQRFHLAAHGRAEVLVLGLHHAPAEVRRDGFGITRNHRGQALASGGRSTRAVPRCHP